MGPVMTNDSSEISELLERLRCGDDKALGELLVRHRDRLRLMVGLRMDNRLRGRIDESDVLQETYAEVTARIRSWPSMKMSTAGWRLSTVRTAVARSRVTLRVISPSA